jgi:23S rRNA pseudouridine2605 synthase
MRLNKFLASAGIASRRKCDDLIQAGRVKVNGEIITTLGHRIDEDSDQIAFDNKVIRSKSDFIYIMLNKPKGVVSTVNDQFKRNTVLDLIPIEQRIFPIGRLDYDTTGLLLLTDDGLLTNQLIHPKYKIKKVYHALLNKAIKPLAVYHLERGIELQGKKTAPCQISEVRVIDNCSLLEVVLYEGRNRQIRRMFNAMGYEVEKLDRIAFGPLTLAGLARGNWRYLSKQEIKRLKNYIAAAGN